MKRVLILANHCLSESDSNGRTLLSLLSGYPADKLAQFCLQDGDPAFSHCERYFCVSDNDALNALLKGRRVGRRLLPGQPLPPAQAAADDKAKHRNALTMLLREAVWRNGAWKRGGFNDFVAEFQPEVVLLQAGDCGFLFRLARRLCRQYGAALVLYNSEGYYFKQFDYFRAKGPAHWCYPLFRHSFCHQFRKTMRLAQHVVYSCDALRECYGQVFSCPGETIYTASTLQSVAAEKTEPFSAAYLGNLGVGRRDGLLAIADALQQLDKRYLLHIYGRVPDADTQRCLQAHCGIRLHGFVPYETVCRVMRETPLLVHTENFSAYYREDLKFAFSTKIADCLASGTCFLLYAPPELASTRYLRQTEAAYVATDVAMLQTQLALLDSQPQARLRYTERAARLVRENHCAATNAARFRTVLNEAGKTR